MEVCWQANPLLRPSASAILRDNVAVTKPAVAPFHPALSTPHSPPHPYIPLPSSTPIALAPIMISQQIPLLTSLSPALETDGALSVHSSPIPNPNASSTWNNAASPLSPRSVPWGTSLTSRMDKEAKAQMRESASVALGDGRADRPPPQDLRKRSEESSFKRDPNMPGIKASSGGTLPFAVEVPNPLVPPVSSVVESAPTVKATFKWVRGELIGKATYGRVYLATNAATGETMALKQVNLPRTPSDRNDEGQTAVVRALRLEIETLKCLDHPHIVEYRGFEKTPANLSMFLKYAPGGSVKSVLLKHGKFSEAVSISFTAQILSGLEYLHSKGILHRDLKAGNILIELPDGVCRISGFGMCTQTTESHGPDTAMMGTIYWMAPEVINPQGKSYNFKVDIWSLGCVVLEMLAGTRPWSGEEMSTVPIKVSQEKTPPPVPAGVVLSELADDFLQQKCFAM
ncbi:mitogen-activated protein kinase kinase kinase [Marasmius sp. AFHP31]|nr:mitogen-activated protein kinase kinase kinase [Marasmius sp. AFHP31]